ncbi:MAG: hybrid sensor histidine kinase/response regulator transcription factor [Pseudobacter sp.]|uniref:hybrid sensor histidine kinase/response regulator transcription factor n=1 Tax=Pseudobacter sp. TaxID=2045420 RepID=UPI003F80EB7A
MQKIAYILFCAVSAICSNTLAQNRDIKFTSLCSRDGFLSNSVNTILKDRYGIMWFGTDDGLNKFDGTNFTVYRYKPGDSTSLPTNEVLTLHEDRTGNLWIGTSGGGLSMYDRKKDRFLHNPVKSDAALLSNSDVIRSICSDYRGMVWIAQFEGLYMLDPQSRSISRQELKDAMGKKIRATLTSVYADSKKALWIATDEGLFRYDIKTNSQRRYEHITNDPASLPDNSIRAVTEDKWGNIWVGTATGLCKLKPDGSGFTRYSFLDKGDISCITADDQGLLWIGCTNGLYTYNIATGTHTVFTQENRNHQSLTSKGVRCVYIDQQGIYWLGTFQGGICKYDKNLNLFDLTLSSSFQENRDHVAVITSLAATKNGNVLLGTDGNGLYELNRKNDQVRPVNIPLKNTQGNNLSVLALLPSGNNKLYIGTYTRGLIILNQQTGQTRQLVKGNGADDLTSNDIFCLFEDSKGNIWTGTNGNGLIVVRDEHVTARYSPLPRNNETLLPINGYIRAIAEDPDGNIWIGTHGGGIAVFTPATGKWKIFTQENSSLPSNKIQCIQPDKKGKMWIGTYSGLAAFNPEKQQFRLYSEKDGLQNTMIYQIVEDNTGKLWLSTNTGISRLDTGSDTFWNFTYMNGLQNSNFVRAAGLQLPDGELFFGGLEGFNHFYPGELRVNRNVPRVILTDLRISNKSVQAGNEAAIKDHISIASEIRLNYKQNFALGFVALNYTMARQNQYAYKLDGFDKDWNYTGSGNIASYTNLDPGEYIFRVKAANNDGIWSANDTTIKVYVKPPFWRTTYAYIFYILAFGAIILYSRHKGISRIRKKFAREQEQQEIERKRQLDQMKIKFLTNLSHDFRTPISLIMGPVDQLIEGEDRPEKQDKLNMIRRNARRLLNLVNQLLDFRTMEEQELKLRLSKGEFISFLKEVTDSFRDMSERKNIEFTLKTCIDRLDAWFDRDKMERILFNLLSNAFKFTLPGGHIVVDLQKAESTDDPEYTMVSIIVTDTGIGIPADKKEMIFNRFFQNENNAILNQGSGIGLSITKEFIELHNGRIQVESEPGKGCSFTIQLPLKRAIEAEKVMPVVQPNLPAPDPDPHPKTPVSAGAENNLPEDLSLLLVEDNEDFRYYLKDNLRNNYKILEAINGKEGWQKTLSNHPQLILTDISMPEMDGIELVNKLKSDKRTSHIPVILLTAMNGHEQQLKGLEAGANDYITKPFNIEVLNAKIRNLLHLKNNMKTAYSKQIHVAMPEVEMESPDAKLLAGIVNYLDNNLTNPQLSVENLSKQIGMSRGTLYARMLEITGETPVEYIRSFRLNKAISLMEKKELSISETAYEVGFTTPNYFTRSFKEKFSMLPSEYIAKIRKQK